MAFRPRPRLEVLASRSRGRHNVWSEGLIIGAVQASGWGLTFGSPRMGLPPSRTPPTGASGAPKAPVGG
eukprot:13149027-Alexandrium_andersonii.AAC.1